MIAVVIVVFVAGFYAGIGLTCAMLAGAMPHIGSDSD